MLEELDRKLEEAHKAYLKKNDELAGQYYENALMDLFLLRKDNCDPDMVRNRILVVRKGLELVYFSRLIADTGFRQKDGFSAFERLLKQDDNPHVKKYRESMAELSKTLEILEEKPASQG